MNDTYDIPRQRTAHRGAQVRHQREIAAAFCARVASFSAHLFPEGLDSGSSASHRHLFGLSRRNPSTGLLLGMVIGILQDSLSGADRSSSSLRHRKNRDCLCRFFNWRAPRYGTSRRTLCPDDRLFWRSPGNRRPRTDAASAPFATRAVVHRASRHRRSHLASSCSSTASANPHRLLSLMPS